MRRSCWVLLSACLLTGCMPRLVRYGERSDSSSQPALPVMAPSSLQQMALVHFIQHRNPQLGADRAEHLASRLAYWSVRNGVKLRLLAAVVSVESAFNRDARSSDGALGLGQLMPGTARDLGVTDPLDIDQNLMGTSRYLSDLMNQWHDMRLAVASYNAGPVAVQRDLANGGTLPPESEQYVAAVMGQYRQIAR